MIENKQYKQDEWWWERIRVQRVLDFHNKKHKTDIVIKGRSTDIYPRLKGQLNWDWVCYDTETSNEIALEVKKLTDEKLEVRQNIIGDVLDEIKKDLLDKLPGTFLLFITIDRKNSYLPLLTRKNKQKFNDILYEVIFQAAHRLRLDDEQAITPQIIEQLPLALPDTFFCTIHKLSDEGSALYVSSGITGSWSPVLNERELEELDNLVSHANEQLQQATNAKQTILTIIEEGLRITIPDTIKLAFKKLKRDSYSNINHIYYLSGDEVENIITQ